MLHAVALWLPGTNEATDPYRIFAQARRVWSAQRYPNYLTYTIVVIVNERGVQKTKHYHLSFDQKSGTIAVNPISDEEVSAPPDPSGTVFHLQLRRQFHVAIDRKAGNPGEAVDYLGVPMIAPTYSFGMGLPSGDEPMQSQDAALVESIRRQFDDPAPQRSAQTSADGRMKTIAEVTSYVRRYTITLAGEEAIAGEDCYHLVLHPNADPKKLRLRDVWIDEHTFETRQLITAGNFTGSNVPWLVRFADVGGAQYIASETALAPVGVGDHRYEQAGVTFAAIAPAQRPVRAQNFFVTKENIMREPGTTADP